MSATSNKDNGIPQGSKLRVHQITVAEPGACFEPEYAGYRELKIIFGLSRTHLYRLAREGRIKSISLRDPGKTKGRRLYLVQSIRALLNTAQEVTK